MTKIVWMASTLGLLSQINSPLAKEVVNNGEIKETEEGIKYVILHEEGLAQDKIN